MPIIEESAVPREQARDAPEPERSPDPSLEDLRHILLRNQAKQIDGLQDDLSRLEHQVYDDAALVKMIAPVLGEAIRLKIREARDEMIEALYPIIGNVVQRAVREAVSDLARSLDAQVKSSFDLRLAWWRMKARLSGASEAQIRLRELLPFAVTDILLIHRETGLLLFHLPSETSKRSNTDLFSGMLTAIRDFSQDTLGGDGHGGLGEITYGDQSILIEAAQQSYLAVIINGIAPPQFRADMRERIIEIEHSHADALRNYQGDGRSLVVVKPVLGSLMAAAPPKKLSASQKRFLAGALATLTVLLVGCGLFTNWVWQLSRQTPAPLLLVIPPAVVTPTIMPSATASLTPTSTSIAVPTATQTFTQLPPTPLIGVILGDVWLHTEPFSDSVRSGAVLITGDQVEILAANGGWVRIRQTRAGQDEVTGWIPARWLSVTGSIPTQLITPSATQ